MKRIVVLLAIATLAIAGLCFSSDTVHRYLDPFDDQVFDPAAWAAADSHARMPMARGAVRLIRAGTSESEVVELLGHGVVEDSHRLTRSAPESAVRTHSYYLGGSILSSIHGMDSAFVWVQVDSDGRVIAAVIGGG